MLDVNLDTLYAADVQELPSAVSKCTNVDLRKYPLDDLNIL